MNQPISELICTRISHDIIGNIGAVANAVELLEEGDMDFLDDIKSILKTSSGVLAARLKFFRMAFGLDNANLQDPAKVQTAIAEYLATVGGKNPPSLRFELQSMRFAKVAMLAVMSLADLLVRGGVINVVEQGGKIIIAPDADARLAAEKLAQSVNVLKSTAAEVSAQDAPLLYLLEQCRAKGIKLSCSSNPVLCFVLE